MKKASLNVYMQKFSVITLQSQLYFRCICIL